MMKKQLSPRKMLKRAAVVLLCIVILAAAVFGAMKAYGYFAPRNIFEEIYFTIKHPKLSWLQLPEEDGGLIVGSDEYRFVYSTYDNKNNRYNFEELSIGRNAYSGDVVLFVYRPIEGTEFEPGMYWDEIVSGGIICYRVYYLHEDNSLDVGLYLSKTDIIDDEGKRSAIFDDEECITYLIENYGYTRESIYEEANAAFEELLATWQEITTGKSRFTPQDWGKFELVDDMGISEWWAEQGIR